MMQLEEGLISPAASTSMRIVVGIATTGRPEQMALTLARIAEQLRLPERVIVCPAREGDFDASKSEGLPFRLDVVRSKPGLCPQRNAILAASADADVVVFFDDDYYPAHSYLQQLERIVAEHPRAAMFTGSVIADGIAGRGLSHEEALDALQPVDLGPPEPGTAGPIYGAYGCNMALRMDLARANALRFDEELPLYAWLEDIDFSRQMASYGDIVKHSGIRGVHLGSKNGRTSGVRLGYSQLANPIYMYRKGTMSTRFAAKQIARNIAANAFRVFYPEPWVDRRGRVLGNALALRDFLTGSLSPRRVLELM